MAKNYFAHGGNELVIGGKLTFLPGATVEGAARSELESELLEFTPPEFPYSEAATIAALRADFNSLLAALREAGILAGEGE